MVPVVKELSPIPLSKEKPSNRGKFSVDREYWEQLHRARYTKWQLGDSVDDIADQEGVTSNAIRHSLAWVEGRMPQSEVVAGRATRLRLQTFARLSERYVTELERLMDDPNPIIRSRALEHFRRTVGLEGAGGVNVSVQQTAVMQSDGPRSFESALAQVKRMHAEEEHRRNLEAGGASSDGRPI